MAPTGVARGPGRTGVGTPVKPTSRFLVDLSPEDAALTSELHQELERFRTELPSVGDEDGLYALQVAYLGKKGSVTKLRGRMRDLTPDERKAFGQAFNQVKSTIETELGGHRSELERRAREADLARREDLTLVDAGPVGTRHILTQTRAELERIFARLGFDVAEGPHIEAEQYNFDDLNIAADHPARDMQDTFFVANRGSDPEANEIGDLVLRTHTSPVQIRTMLGRKPPVKIVAPGTVFRRDDDATHSPMFHQLEGLRVDRGVSMADLKATLYRFVGAVFGKGLDIRFRPSYFPFVEPGAEFDMECPFCKDTKSNKPCSVCKDTRWIELGGSGMVHPAVFEAVGYDPEVYTGWAFGFGIDRMAMLLHGVRDLRLLFEGDTRLLEQFQC